MHARSHSTTVCIVLACYGCARVLQVLHGPPPTLSLVAAEVVAARAFAVVDGSRNLGGVGILVFAAICAVVGNVMENIGLATGFPYGHYRFLEVMGPRLFEVPVLLGLAYVGMAYVSWTLAWFLFSDAPRGPAIRFLALPFTASAIMVAWDVAQDPVWSTVLHAWVWRDGGSWFGVPLSNYFGWFLTVFLIFVLFAAFEQRRGPDRTMSAWPSLALYSLCAAGNVLQLLTRSYAPVSVDPSGAAWRTVNIFAASAAVSIFVMGSFVALAAVRLLACAARQSATATD
ncbi:MAG TPA: carotenoid biosynthesis protein [Terracidiphilus sp.]|nr:carotenoid biosynthesis protein [Terracidiphilus sp.]